MGQAEGALSSYLHPCIPSPPLRGRSSRAGGDRRGVSVDGECQGYFAGTRIGVAGDEKGLLVVEEYPWANHPMHFLRGGQRQEAVWAATSAGEALRLAGRRAALN